MMSMFSARRWSGVVVIAATVMFTARPSLAQQVQTTNDRSVTVAGAIDVRNAYMFRGIRQDDTGTIMLPAAEIGLRLHSADHGLKSARDRRELERSSQRMDRVDGPSGKR